MRLLAKILSLCFLASVALAAPPAIPPSAPFSVAPYALNLNYSQNGPIAMQRWRALINQIGYAGANNSTPIRVPVAILGDSTCVGFGISSAGGGLGNAWNMAWPQQVAKIMTAAGIPTQINSVWGQSNLTGVTPSSYTVYNTTVVFGSNTAWTLSSTTNTTVLGGFAFRYTNAGAAGYNNAASTMTFTPNNAFDTFDIHWVATGGTVTVNVDGGAALTVASGLGAGGSTITIPTSFGGYANFKSTFSVTHGTHAINIVVQSGTTTEVAAVHSYDSTISYVDLMPMCAYGATLSTFALNTPSFLYPAYLTSIVQPLVYIWPDLTVNDIANGTTSATYISEMNALAADWKAGNGTISVGWMIGPWTNNLTPTGPIINNSIIAALLATAPTQAFNLAGVPPPVIDFASRWQGTAISELMGGDGIHPTMAGDMDAARYIAYQWLN
jgi:lysophospholipase L1-like esterase